MPTPQAWPVCHVYDNTNLYLSLLHAILNSDSPSTPPSGKQGYYLASPGAVRWSELYAALATALHAQGAVATPTVSSALSSPTPEGAVPILEQMGNALGCAPELVSLQLGGKCTLTARNAQHNLAWKPRYEAQHVLRPEVAEEEVARILGAL